MLRELVERPPDPGERHHPVRLFIGSGMPRGLWRRVEQRFAPARVLEFYTSAEGEAVLVNVADAKPGAAGRRLPGSAELRIAAYDAARGALLEGADGFAIECAPGEVGMLLARERQGAAAGPGDGRLQDVFEPDDAWLSTGDLFRRDGDGDHWLVGDVAELIHAAHGVVPARPIADALGELEAVDLAVAYGARADGGAGEIAVAAVTQRAGEHAPLDAGEITRGLQALARMLARRSSTSCARSRSRRGTGRSRRRCAGAACHARAAAPGSATATATGRSRPPIARCSSPNAASRSR